MTQKWTKGTIETQAKEEKKVGVATQKGKSRKRDQKES